MEHNLYAPRYARTRRAPSVRLCIADTHDVTEWVRHTRKKPRPAICVHKTTWHGSHPARCAVLLLQMKPAPPQQKRTARACGHRPHLVPCRNGRNATHRPQVCPVSDRWRHSESLFEFMRDAALRYVWVVCACVRVPAVLAVLEACESVCVRHSPTHACIIDV